MSVKKTHVVLVANSTWNIYNFRLNVINYFLEKNYQVTVVAPIDEYLEYKEKYPDIEHFGIKSMNRDGTNPFKDLILTIELIRRYRLLKPDILIHYTNKMNIYGAIAARMNRIKSIAIVTGLGYPFIRKGWLRSLTTFLYKSTAGFHEKFIFENIEDRELFESLNIIPKGKGTSIKGCGVDLDYFKPQPKKRKSDTIVFTFVGRLLYDKGIKEFVNAAQVIKEKYSNRVEFWVVGDLDPDNPATVEKIELGNWVNQKLINYFGFQRDVRPFLKDSDCIVLPSYREAIPRTITEGMAMARPVITTNTAGCREAVDEGQNGYLVEVRDVNSLVVAMEKFILLSPEEKHSFGQNGLKKAQMEFDDKNIAEQIYLIATDDFEGQ